jgi:hypothetical protein
MAKRVMTLNLANKNDYSSNDNYVIYARHEEEEFLL